MWTTIDVKTTPKECPVEEVVGNISIGMESAWDKVIDWVTSGCGIHVTYRYTKDGFITLTESPA